MEAVLMKEGKVRKLYAIEAQGQQHILMVAGDGVSAFDRKLGVEIPGKGLALTTISAFWFRMLIRQKVCQTAYVKVPSRRELAEYGLPEEWAGRTTEMQQLQMIPVEAIVRGYITGSMWKDYCAGKREICGVNIDEPYGITNGGGSLLNCEQLPRPIFTPTTKAPEGEHDENISFEQMVNLIETEMELSRDQSIEVAVEIRNAALRLYEFCYNYAYEHGIILADTKFEFGLDNNGNVLLADEVCTPDSTRFWWLNLYRVGQEQKSMDKQPIRDWLAAQKKAGVAEPNLVTNPELIEKTRVAYWTCYAMLQSKRYPSGKNSREWPILLPAIEAKPEVMRDSDSGGVIVSVVTGSIQANTDRDTLMSRLTWTAAIFDESTGKQTYTRVRLIPKGLLIAPIASIAAGDRHYVSEDEYELRFYVDVEDGYELDAEATADWLLTLLQL